MLADERKGEHVQPYAVSTHFESYRRLCCLESRGELGAMSMDSVVMKARLNVDPARTSLSST
jgi:hypothetical protein